MTNEQNLIRARHAESLANDISDFITQSNSDLHQAVQAELAELDTSGGASAVVLGSASSTVDGSLWLEGENYSPVVKLFSDGNVYTFQTQPDFNLVNYSTATVGANVTISNDNTYFVGSAYNDSIDVQSARDTIICGEGNDYVVCYNSSASSAYIEGTAGNNEIRIPSNNTVICGSDNNTVEIFDGGSFNYIDARMGTNYIGSFGSNVTDNTIICGAGNDTVKFLYSAARNYFNVGAGDNYISCSSGEDNTIVCGTGNNLINVRGSNPKIYCGTGNDSISSRATGIFIDANSGSNTISVSGGSGTVYGGSGNDSIYVNSGYTVYSGSGNNTIQARGNPELHFETGTNNISCSSNNGTSVEIFGFKNSDTLKTSSSLNSSILDNSQSLITLMFQLGATRKSTVTLLDYTAEQFHISAADVDGVYTIQGSKLVPAGS